MCRYDLMMGLSLHSTVLTGCNLRVWASGIQISGKESCTTSLDCSPMQMQKPASAYSVTACHSATSWGETNKGLLSNFLMWCTTYLPNLPLNLISWGFSIEVKPAARGICQNCIWDFLWTQAKKACFHFNQTLWFIHYQLFHGNKLDHQLQICAYSGEVDICPCSIARSLRMSMRTDWTSIAFWNRCYFQIEL